MTRDEVLALLRRVLASEFELEPEAIVPEARLREDLDLDSVDGVALAARLESETGHALKEERLRRLRSVDDVVTLVHGLLAGAARV